MYNPKESCYLCGSKDYVKIHSGVRGSKDVNVLKCSHCGLVRLDRFVTEEEGFYENSGMWDSNGMASNVRQARIDAKDDDERRAQFLEGYIKNRRVLDFGCGSGGVIKLISGIVSNVAGVELENDKREYLNKEGFECFSSIDAIPEDAEYDVITLFHVLEHLPDPVEILEKLKKHLSDNGKIIIEVPNADDALLTMYKSEEFADFTYWVCHLYLYTNQTLCNLADKCGLKTSIIQQIQRYPLSNHLYWLSKKKPGGHKEWAAFNNQMLDTLYGERLATLGIADTILAVFTKA